MTLLAALLLLRPTPLTRDAVSHFSPRTLAARHSARMEWRDGWITQYADCFDGQTTASGVIFRQSEISCAATFVPLGTWLEIRYGARMVIVQVTDTGDLGANQIDVSRATAKRLGLYRLTNGRTDRRITYRIINTRGGNE